MTAPPASVHVINFDTSLQATMIGNKVYIFGGEDRSRRAVADLFVLDMTSLQWSKPEVDGLLPTARSAHVACAVEDRFLLIFGGGSVARCYNDVWAFDTEAGTWSSLKPAGPAPSARAGELHQPISSGCLAPKCLSGLVFCRSKLISCTWKLPSNLIHSKMSG